jgi:uncharacterized SAM-binding protein YcdF (DUF218 family)
VINVLKDQFHLSAPVWLPILVTIGLIWLWRRPAARGARFYFAALAAGYWLVTTPIGARLLTYGLSRDLTRVVTREDARQSEVVVVLGAGASTAKVGSEAGATPTLGTVLRGLEGARAFKVSGARTLIVSGGMPRPDRQMQPESGLLRDIAVRAGVPAASVIEESDSKTTREQARLVAPILRQHHSQRFILVTSPTHMRRALAVFRATGFDPVASMAPYRSEHLREPWLLLPNDESFALSDAAVYEYAALLYYWLRGWMTPPPA